ncbi:hypothetical protein H6802_02525 [Candidatus Nomurabacteria bacterium]|uniref:Uncharacterized protein n=1 Tax=candidate division WWE3 bacterium TaxID=2053526 RepID=A0A955IVL3_UNCKA|nr:hypothetical protein [candidate division WWE3 bacterium]MCB9823809.1 hypothetical protein [Candidatus Nomurabacteria bacterium]MCB9826785.1 hypothetical protein [Candidatus Nomurabacteria bacterium]MCB9827604.1 hypothetical protein [Candidatus Nomurabacteria bacterium]HXK52608.1 hypothetical protein [bacterium]
MKLNNYYDREIQSRPYRNFVLFLCFLAFNVVVVGYFGAVRGYSAYKYKKDLVKEFSEQGTIIKNNINRVALLEPYLVRNLKTEIIMNGVPVEKDYDGMIFELSQIARINGLSLDEVKGTSSNDSSVTKSDYVEYSELYSAKLTGDISALPKFLQDLSVSKRVYAVVSARADVDSNPNSGKDTLIVTFAIYYIN